MHSFNGDAISWTPKLTATSTLQSFHGEDLHPSVADGNQLAENRQHFESILEALFSQLSNTKFIFVQQINLFNYFPFQLSSQGSHKMYAVLAAGWNSFGH